MGRGAGSPTCAAVIRRLDIKFRIERWQHRRAQGVGATATATPSAAATTRDIVTAIIRTGSVWWGFRSAEASTRAAAIAR